MIRIAENPLHRASAMAGLRCFCRCRRVIIILYTECLYSTKKKKLELASRKRIWYWRMYEQGTPCTAKVDYGYVLACGNQHHVLLESSKALSHVFAQFIHHRLSTQLLYIIYPRNIMICKDWDKIALASSRRLHATKHRPARPLSSMTVDWWVRDTNALAETGVYHSRRT